MLERLRSKKGIILLAVVLMVVLGACSSGKGQDEEVAVEEDDGLRTELHKDEEVLLEKDYADFTDRERKLFDTLEDGSTISDKLKETIKDDVARLSEEKEIVLKEEAEEEEKRAAARKEEEKKKAEKEKEPEVKESNVSVEEIRERIEDNISATDSINNISLEGGKIVIGMSVDTKMGDMDLPIDTASVAYSNVSDKLIEMNKDNKFWDVLRVNFKSNGGKEIGSVEMNYKDIQSNEFGSFFDPVKIDKQLGR